MPPRPAWVAVPGSPGSWERTQRGRSQAVWARSSTTGPCLFHPGQPRFAAQPQSSGNGTRWFGEWASILPTLTGEGQTGAELLFHLRVVPFQPPAPGLTHVGEGNPPAPAQSLAAGRKARLVAMKAPGTSVPLLVGKQTPVLVQRLVPSMGKKPKSLLARPRRRVPGHTLLFSLLNLAVSPLSSMPSLGACLSSSKI